VFYLKDTFVKVLNIAYYLSMYVKFLQFQTISEVLTCGLDLSKSIAELCAVQLVYFKSCTPTSSTFLDYMKVSSNIFHVSKLFFKHLSAMYCLEGFDKLHKIKYENSKKIYCDTL